MNISCIVAMSDNLVIGKDNQLPWKISEDLKNFKRLTMGHHIIMGRKCFESIGRPLPGRTNVVISRNPSFWHQGIVVVSSIEQALELSYQNGDTECFIIGGGEIYHQSKHLWTTLYLTQIGGTFDGDVFFPQVDYEEWALVKEKKMDNEPTSRYDVVFKVLKKN